MSEGLGAGQEGRDPRRTLHPGRRLDTGGDIDRPGAADAYRLGQVVRIEPARQHPRAPPALPGEEPPVEGQRVAAGQRVGHLRGRPGVEQQPLGDADIGPRRFDVFDTIEDALDHLEAITDEALKAEIAMELAEDSRIRGSAGGFLTLLLALQDDREALSALMDQLIRSDGDNPLVAAIHQSFDEEPRERVASRLADIDLGALDGDGALALVADLKALIEGRKP